MQLAPEPCHCFQWTPPQDASPPPVTSPSCEAGRDLSTPPTVRPTGRPAGEPVTAMLPSLSRNESSALITGLYNQRMSLHWDYLLSTLPGSHGSPACRSTQGHISFWGAGVGVLVARNRGAGTGDGRAKQNSRP
eukprot:bmy_01899T0